MAESYFSALKNEWFVFTLRAKAERQVIRCIEGFFNHRRRHSALGCRPPLEVLNEFLSHRVGSTIMRRLSGISVAPHTELRGFGRGVARVVVRAGGESIASMRSARCRQTAGQVDDDSAGAGQGRGCRVKRG